MARLLYLLCFSVEEAVARATKQENVPLCEKEHRDGFGCAGFKKVEEKPLRFRIHLQHVHTGSLKTS